MAVPISNWAGQYYDFDELKQSVEFFNAMTYDIHGSWTNHAGHNAPLYPSPIGDPDGSVSTGINYLLNTRGIEPNKLNMGIPFYGIEYNAPDINQPFTEGVVYRYYNEYYELINNGWDYIWDSDGQVPYLKNTTEDKIITIDDSLSVSIKSGYAISNNLGGLMIWALGYDYIDGTQKLVQSMKYNYLNVDVDPNPNKFSVNIINYPNPFNPVTSLRYDLSEDEFVNITIYDMVGRKVKTLVNGSQTAGYKSVQWNATNDNGAPVSAGIYLYTIQAGEFRQTKKMVLLK